MMARAHRTSNVISGDAESGASSVPFFGCNLIEGHEAKLAAAFCSVRAIPFVCEKIFNRGEKESPKSSPERVRSFHDPVLEELGKESLHQILGVGRRITAAANETYSGRQ